MTIPHQGERSRVTLTVERWLQQFFGGVELTVLAGVVQRSVAVGALFTQVNLASLNGLGVHVNADRALVEFREIEHLVHRLQWIYVCRMRGIHLVDVGG